MDGWPVVLRVSATGDGVVILPGGSPTLGAHAQSARFYWRRSVRPLPFRPRRRVKATLSLLAESSHTSGSLPAIAERRKEPRLISTRPRARDQGGDGGIAKRRAAAWLEACAAAASRSTASRPSAAQARPPHTATGIRQHGLQASGVD